MCQIFTGKLATINAEPYAVYSSTGGEPELLVFHNGGSYVYMPPLCINALYLGDTTVYNQNITYLDAPLNLQQDCTTAVINGFDSIPDGTDVTIMTGVTTEASGTISLSPFGIKVFYNEDFTSPLFVFNPNIIGLITTEPPETFGAKTIKPTVRQIKKVSIINKTE